MSSIVTFPRQSYMLRLWPGTTPRKSSLNIFRAQSTTVKSVYEIHMSRYTIGKDRTSSVIFNTSLVESSERSTSDT